MNIPRSTSPSVQQQQPGRAANRQQQQSSGSREFQPGQAQQGDGRQAQQIGEGSYEGSRDYQNSIQSYLKSADVSLDAKAAKPATAKERAELEKAEQEGLSHSRSPSR
jgi:hypothetical protein